MKKRIIALTLVVVVLALTLSDLVGGALFRQYQVNTAKDSLQGLLDVLALETTQMTDEQFLAKVASYATVLQDKRLTVLNHEGMVLYDSMAEPSQMDSHASRKEFMQAKDLGYGEDIRQSETKGIDMLYKAKKLDNGWVVRLAMPLANLNEFFYNTMISLLAASLLAIALSYLLSQRFSKGYLQPLYEIHQAITQIIQGRTQVQISEAFLRYDEFRTIYRDINGMIGTLEDYVQTIKREKEKIRLILDCMDQGLVLLDDKLTILTMNQAACQFFKLQPEDAVGNFLTVTHQRTIWDAISLALKEKKATIFDLSDAVFDEKILRFFINPVQGKDYDGHDVGVMLLISDVSALKKAEQVRSEFTANVSHELKTPLTSIKGMTEMLAQDMVPEQEIQKRFLTMIGVEVDRLIGLINHILKFSELESCVIEQPKASTKVSTVLQEVCEVLKPAAQSAKIELELLCHGGEIAMDPERFRELISNLLDNAIKYNVEKGSVYVSCEIVGDMMEIMVKDTGIGIPEACQERIFERFYRVDKGRSQKTGGSGLGLAIVKHIVSLYNGNITVKSVEHVGTEIVLHLPLETQGESYNKIVVN